MTEQEVLQRMRDEAAKLGSRKAWAALYGVSEAYVADVIKGKSSPGPKILAAMRLERVVVYRAAGG